MQPLTSGRWDIFALTSLSGTSLQAAFVCTTFAHTGIKCHLLCIVTLNVPTKRCLKKRPKRGTNKLSHIAIACAARRMWCTLVQMIAC